MKPALKVQFAQDPERPAEEPRPANMPPVQQVALDRVAVRPDLFQARDTSLGQPHDDELVRQLVENWNPERFDPLAVVADPDTGGYIVIAGHHRLEAVKRLGHDSVPVKVLAGDVTDAADRRRLTDEAILSNFGVSAPNLQEQVRAAGLLQSSGHSDADIAKEMRIKRNEAKRLIDLHSLPPGIVGRIMIQPELMPVASELGRAKTELGMTDETIGGLFRHWATQYDETGEVPGPAVLRQKLNELAKRGRDLEGSQVRFGGLEGFGGETTMMAFQQELADAEEILREKRWLQRRLASCEKLADELGVSIPRIKELAQTRLDHLDSEQEAKVRASLTLHRQNAMPGTDAEESPQPMVVEAPQPAEQFEVPPDTEPLAEESPQPMVVEAPQPAEQFEVPPDTEPLAEESPQPAEPDAFVPADEDSYSRGISSLINRIKGWRRDSGNIRPESRPDSRNMQQLKGGFEGRLKWAKGKVGGVDVPPATLPPPSATLPPEDQVIYGSNDDPWDAHQVLLLNAPTRAGVPPEETATYKRMANALLSAPSDVRDKHIEELRKLRPWWFTTLGAAGEAAPDYVRELTYMVGTTLPPKKEEKPPSPPSEEHPLPEPFQPRIDAGPATQSAEEQQSIDDAYNDAFSRTQASLSEWRTRRQQQSIDNFAIATASPHVAQAHQDLATSFGERDIPRQRLIDLEQLKKEILNAPHDVQRAHLRQVKAENHSWFADYDREEDHPRSAYLREIEQTTQQRGQRIIPSYPSEHGVDAAVIARGASPQSEAFFQAHRFILDNLGSRSDDYAFRDLLRQQSIITASDDSALQEAHLREVARHYPGLFDASGQLAVHDGRTAYLRELQSPQPSIAPSIVDPRELQSPQPSIAPSIVDPRQPHYTPTSITESDSIPIPPEREQAAYPIPEMNPDINTLAGGRHHVWQAHNAIMDTFDGWGRIPREHIPTLRQWQQIMLDSATPKEKEAHLREMRRQHPEAFTRFGKPRTGFSDETGFAEGDPTGYLKEVSDSMAPGSGSLRWKSSIITPFQQAFMSETKLQQQRRASKGKDKKPGQSPASNYFVRHSSPQKPSRRR